MAKKDKEYAVEPWGPQAIFIEKCLDPNETFVAKWNKRQVRFLSEVSSVIQLCEKYLHVDPMWLKEEIEMYMKLSKFLEGYCIKMSKDVARGGLSRMFLNIARWKKIFYGEETAEE